MCTRFLKTGPRLMTQFNPAGSTATGASGCCLCAGQRAPPPALPPHSCTEAQGYTLQLVCPSAVPSRPNNGEGNTLQRPSGRLTETRLLHRPGQPRVEMTRRSTRRRVDADGRSHPVEHDSALTQNKVQTPATAWVSPENVLSEGSQPP